MSWLAWVASLGPIVSFGLGWAFGYGRGRVGDAGTIASLQYQLSLRELQVENLLEQVAALSHPLDDDEFDGMLREAASGGND